MLSFKRVELADKERLRPILLKEPDRGCEYTFGNIFIWRDVYKTEIAWVGECAVVRFGDMVPGYLFPVGSDPVKAVEEIVKDPNFRIIAARKDDCDLLEKLFPGRFAFDLMKDAGEYIYLSESLRELSGKKLHKKRNHLANFERDYPDWSFHVLTRDNLDRVREMDDRWCNEYGCAQDSGLRSEHCAVESAIDNLFELGLEGGYVETGGDVVAFAIGEPVNDKCYCVHIEKAFHTVNGAYAIINREFARQFCSQYELINREDDAGEDGLRKAKLSYYPEEISEKYIITTR